MNWMDAARRHHGRSGGGLPRCLLRNSVKLRARVGGLHTKKAPHTSGRLKKRARLAARVDRSAAVDAAGSSSPRRRWRNQPPILPIILRGTGSRIGKLRRRERMVKRVAMAMAAALAVSAVASAQTSGSGQAQTTSTTPQSTSSSSYDYDVRPATTTPYGDTGLWFVPTGEILPAKR